MNYKKINDDFVETLKKLEIACDFEETNESLAATLVATLMEIEGELLENRASNLHMYASGIREELRSEESKLQCYKIKEEITQ